MLFYKLLNECKLVGAGLPGGRSLHGVFSHLRAAEERNEPGRDQNWIYYFPLGRPEFPASRKLSEEFKYTASTP